MPVRRIALAVVSSAWFIAVPSSAQNMKPGLWEVNNKMQSDNKQMEEAMSMMQQHLANLPADQRKQVEGMMNQHGMHMPTQGKDGALQIKMCITPDMAAVNDMPIYEDGNCSQKHSAVVGKTMKVSFTCSTPKARGDGQVTFHSNTDYSMKMKVSTDNAGKPDVVNMNLTGRWLAADCGKIRPKAK